MKYLILLALATLVACENSRFGIEDQTSVTRSSIAWEGEPALADLTASSGGAYELGLAAIDLTSTTPVTLSIIDPSTSSTLFKGDFLPGDDISSAIPTNTSGLSNFATDIQPYFETGSILDDASALTFRKKDWAVNSGQFQSLFNPANPLDLDTSGDVAIPLQFQLTTSGSTATITLPVRYRLSFENTSTDGSGVGGAFPLTFPNVFTVGGLIRSDTIGLLGVTGFSESCGPGTEHYNMDSTMSPATTTTATKVAGVWVPFAGTAQSRFTTAILTTLGATQSFNQNFGTHCVHRMGGFSQLNEFLDVRYEAIRLTDDGTNFLEIAFSVFEAF